MKFRRKSDGTIEFQPDKNKKYKIIYHGYNKKGEYLVWYLDNKGNQIFFDSVKLKELLNFVEGIEI